MTHGKMALTRCASSSAGLSFFTLGPQSPIGNFSAISIVETQIDYIVDCIKMATHGNIKTIDPKTSATNAFNEMVYAAMIQYGERMHQLVYW